MTKRSIPFCFLLLFFAPVLAGATEVESSKIDNQKQNKGSAPPNPLVDLYTKVANGWNFEQRCRFLSEVETRVFEDNVVFSTLKLPKVSHITDTELKEIQRNAKEHTSKDKWRCEDTGIRDVVISSANYAKQLRKELEKLEPPVTQKQD